MSYLFRELDGRRLFVVRPHWFNDQSFCEVGWHGVLTGAFPKVVTQAMVTGGADHGQKEEEFLEEAEEAEDFGRDVINQTEGVVESAEFFEEVAFNDFYFTGKIDVLHSYPDRLEVFDRKKTFLPQFGMGARRQAWAYCVMLRQQYQPTKKLFWGIMETKSSEVFEKEEFLPRHEQEMLDTCRRMQDLVLGKREPEPPAFPNKCLKCKHAAVCGKKLCD